MRLEVVDVDAVAVGAEPADRVARAVGERLAVAGLLDHRARHAIDFAALHRLAGLDLILDELDRRVARRADRLPDARVIAGRSGRPRSPSR